MNDILVQDGLSIQFDTTEGDFLSAMGLDKAEALMMEHGEPVECPVEHGFYPGLYVRTITMPARTLVASKIHRTEHPFVILRGDVSVWIKGMGTVRFKGPHQGRTYPGTRRLLFCHEETVWQTFHVNPHGETLEEIEERIIEPHFNPLTGMTHREMSQIANHDNCVLHND